MTGASRAERLSALATACALAAWADRAALRFALTPGRFDLLSLRLLIERGLWPVLIAAVLLLALSALGRRLLRLLTSGDDADLPSALALGTGAYASALFALGLAGQLRPWPVVALTAGCAVGGDWTMPARRATEDRRGRENDAAGLWLLKGLLAYAAFHGLIAALAPPTDSDVLAYHLALPKLYAEAGRIAEIPWLLHSHWPHLLEVLYSAALLIRRDAVAALIHWAGAAALVAAVFAAAKRRLDEPTAWLAAAILAVQPPLIRFAGVARSDAWWALFHFLACVQLWHWKGDPRRSSLAVAGLLAGLAAASKLLGLIPLATLAGWVFLQSRPAGRGIKDAGLFLAWASAPAVPWYAKAWLGAGDPVWPFLSSLFGARWGAASFISAYIQANRWPLPALPASLLRYGPQFVLGPLGVAALWALARRRGGGGFPPFLRFLLLVGAPYALCIGGHVEAWRLLLPFLPALVLTLAWALRRLAEAGRRGWLAAAALGAVALAPALALDQNNQLFAVLELRSGLSPGADPRELYLARSLPSYAFFRRVDAALAGKRGRTLLYPEGLGYYLDFPYQWGDSIYQGLIPYDQLADPEELSGRLRALGISHVLFAPDAAAGQNPRAAQLMIRALERHGRRIMSDGASTLYRLGSS